MSAPPPPLLESLDEVGAAVEASSRLAVFLDFDGTLAPIAESPKLAQLPLGTRAVLERLARCDDCTLGVVSGRSLDDVRRRVGIDGLIYAGNHGLEIRGGGLHFDEPSAVAFKTDVGGAVGVLAPLLNHVDGVLVEPKGLTASVHYRRVRAEDRDEVERVVRRVVPEDHPTLVVAAGKMVWEVRPRVVWNKGKAVGWIRKSLGLGEALTFYLGDDHTDEDAFAEVGRFVTARVGPPQPTRAGYRLADVAATAEFLEWLSRRGRFSIQPA